MILLLKTPLNIEVWVDALIADHTLDIMTTTREKFTYQQTAQQEYEVERLKSTLKKKNTDAIMN